MLTVLADDITGAAEIAGVCLRFGLSVSFDLDFNIRRLPETDVWIIASDTRSLPEKEACDLVKTIAYRLKEQQVKTLYKKIDSVLRGHIIPEIKVLQEYFPIDRIFILPANPETGRIIRNGIYYINELPLNQTSFANDPDFPAKTASIRDILRLPMPSPPLWGGVGGEVIIPDILSNDDYEKYARQISPQTLPVGGSVFFEACLPVYFPAAKSCDMIPQPIRKGSSMLMISGSTHEVSRKFIRENQIFKTIEIDACWVEKLLEEPENFQIRIENVIAIFNRWKRIIITVKNECDRLTSPEKVKKLLAAITAELIRKCTIDELLIEGGATACACLQATGFTSLIPVEEYARGVIRFKISGKEHLHLTIKPGSYEWAVEMFESINLISDIKTSEAGIML